MGVDPDAVVVGVYVVVGWIVVVGVTVVTGAVVADTVPGMH